jgi:hypothetical protein
LQLIGATQRVEHYEVAAYGTARAEAEKFGIAQAAELLRETPVEEEHADTELTQVAERLYGQVKTGEEEGEGTELREDSATQGNPLQHSNEEKSSPEEGLTGNHASPASQVRERVSQGEPAGTLDLKEEVGERHMHEKVAELSRLLDNWLKSVVARCPRGTPSTRCASDGDWSKEPNAFDATSVTGAGELGSLT